MKKAYVKPLMQSEAFVPDEYVAACYNYTAEFYCRLGQQGSSDWNGGNHGNPCSTTIVDINGNFDMTGHETGIKEHINIYNINFCDGFELYPGMEKGTRIPCVTWQSRDGGVTYYHEGTGKITSAVAEIPGRPNHS